MPDSNQSTVVTINGNQWRKVTRPKPWKPEDIGESIVGFWGGRTTRNGSYGTYEVLTLHTEHGTFYVSGSVLMGLLDGAGVMTDSTRLRVVFLGLKPCHEEDRRFKDFELFVGA